MLARPCTQQARMEPVDCSRWPRTTKVSTIGHFPGSFGTCGLPAATMQLLEVTLTANPHLRVSCDSKSSNIETAPCNESEALRRLSTQVHKQKTSVPAWNPHDLQAPTRSDMMLSTGTRPSKPAILLPVRPPAVRFGMHTSAEPHLKITRGHI